MCSSENYFQHALNIRTLPCDYHKHNGTCFLYESKGSIIHVRQYDYTTETDTETQSSTCVPIPTLACKFLKIKLDKWIIPFTGISYNYNHMMPQACLPSDLISFTKHVSIDMVIQYYIQLYVLRIYLLKHYACVNEKEMDCRNWQILRNNSGELFILDGFSKKMSLSIIYSIKQQMGLQLGMEIISEKAGTKTLKSLKSIIKKHSENCLLSTNGYYTKICHKWLDVLDNSQLRYSIMTRLYDDFKSYIFRFNPLKVPKNNKFIKYCPDSALHQCCFRNPEYVPFHGHKLFCQVNVTKGYEVLSYASNYTATKYAILSNQLRSDFVNHKKCMFCKSL
jgi:hypothetical protein